MNKIQKIISILNKTDLGFTRTDLKKLNECKYCAEGVLAKNLVPDDVLEYSISLMGICQDKPYYKYELINKYGIDFSNDYNGNKIKCIICDEGKDYINDRDTMIWSLNELIVHINDTHSTSHKQTAIYLKEFSKSYDLIEGVKK